MKVVINNDYGGFSLTKQAMKYFNDLKRKRGKPTVDYYGDIERDDAELIETVEHLTPEVASGTYASLKITEIPDGIEWDIEDYDGNEWVSERHRTWG